MRENRLIVPWGWTVQGNPVKVRNGPAAVTEDFLCKNHWQSLPGRGRARMTRESEDLSEHKAGTLVDWGRVRNRS